MNNRHDSFREEILAAHEAEIQQVKNQSEIKAIVISDEQIHKVQQKYAKICAEYAACRGIYNSYHNAKMDDKAKQFAVGANIAIENAKVVGEVLDILGIKHTSYH